MLNFTGHRYRHCDGLSRRAFLSAGSLAVGGLTLPGLLRAGGSLTGSRAVIMVYMPGGPPHQDMYDPKPDAPAEIRGEFQPIATALPGVHLSEMMPMLAARLKQFALIRSVVGSDGAHASTQCLTGWPFRNHRLSGDCLEVPARAPAGRGRGAGGERVVRRLRLARQQLRPWPQGDPGV